MYVFVSYRLFILTGILKEVVVPNKTGREMLRNYLTLAVATLVLFLCGFLVVGMTGLKDFSSPTVAVAAKQHFDP